ncbi:MAG: T9SS type A sorting domain-containing protein, partial [Bacteroidetes bacterium]|nr:T9SS type A sorting domain-containing protein [Bacteroidota bacterium]
ANVNCIGVNSNGDIFEGNNCFGGLYKLLEGSIKWQNISQNSSIGHIIFRNDEILITVDNSIIHSLDNGNTWNVLGIIANQYEIGGIAIDTINNILYAGALYLYASSNNGASWTQTTMPASNDVIVDTNGTVFTCTHCDGGVYRSFNSGLTYTQILPNATNVSKLAINSYNEIFAGAYGWSPGLFKSINGGNSWTEIDSTFTDKTIYDLMIDSNDNIYVLTSDGEMHISTDRGNSWSNYPTNIITACSIFHDEIHEKILIGSMGDGIYSSDDALVNWEWLSDSLNNTNVFSFNQNMSGDLYCGTDLSIFKSTNNGEKWNKLDFPEVRNNIIRKIVSNANGYVFACTDQMGLYRSINNGLTWQNIDNGITHGQMLDMTVNINGDLFVSDPGNGLFRSTDNGNQWQQLDTINMSKSLQAIAITKSGAVLAAQFMGDTIYRSMDNGNNWQKISFPDYYITKLIVLPDSTIMTLGAINGTFASYDDGLTWTNICSNNSFEEIFPDENNNLYGLNSYGLYVSYDYGINWSIVSILSDDRPNTFLITENNDFFIGTGRNGIYKNDSTYFVSSNHHLQNDFGISIFPNPATDNLTISTIEKSTIEVLNIQCQILKTIKSNEMNTKIDVVNLPSGIYLIKATSSKGVG